MPRRTSTVVLVVALALLGPGLTGCAAATDGQTGTGSVGGSSASSGVGTTPGNGTGVPPTTVTPTVPASTTARGPATTLRGTLSRGALEGSCLVLTTGSQGADAGRKYLLLGDSATLHGLTIGKTVAVSGHPGTGLDTACQSGTPFLVEQVLPPS
jgi:hypothetical protein